MTRRGTITLGDQRGHRRPVLLGRRLRQTLFGALAVSYLFWARGAMDERTRVKQALVDVSRIEHAARLFRADHGRCPDGLEELVSPPAGQSYLPSAVDPWGQPYSFRCPARRDPGGVEVMSRGPDGNIAGDDNISSL